MPSYKVVGTVEGASTSSYIWRRDVTDDIEIAKERLCLAKRYAAYTSIDIHENIGGRPIKWEIEEAANE